MSPVSHFLLGWLVAQAGQVDRRERLLITVSGIIPDIDGLGIVADYATRHSAAPLEWWGKYHHVLGHNICFAVLVTAGSYLLAKKKKLLTAFLVWTSFHLHLFCDVIGSRGPDGFQWPIPYLLPFSKSWQWTWQGQWALNAWPNLVITAVTLATTLYLAWKRGYSPLELISRRADAGLIISLHSRFGYPSK